MSKSLSSLTRLSREDLQGAPDWVEPLLTATNEFQEQATASLDRRLLVAEHAKVELVHGVEARVQNPFGSGLIGVEDVRCIGLEVGSDGRPSGGVYTLGVGRLDWRHIQSRAGEPSMIGVTAYFAPPHGRVDLRRTTAQTIANDENTAIQWTTQTAAIGEMSHSTSSNPDRITCAKAGVVLVTATATFASNTTGVRNAFLSPDSGTTVYALTSITPPGVTPVQMHAQVPVTVGQVLRAYVYQNSGGNLDLAATSNFTTLQARYVEAATTTRGRITLRFDGGT
jgi:hypothetical protein